MENHIIDSNLINEIKLLILNGKQDSFPAQKVITILNKLQNLPKIENKD
tara:strand:+ start:5347 stop:5493 length:147 start_codon:yes stop_codon:yes gene_type:complete